MNHQVEEQFKKLSEHEKDLMLMNAINEIGLLRVEVFALIERVKGLESNVAQLTVATIFSL